MFLTDGYVYYRNSLTTSFLLRVFNAQSLLSKQLKNVGAMTHQWLRGTSLPDRSPEGGAVKDYRCVPASEEDRKQLDVVLEEFNEIALKSDENEVKASAEMCVSLL